MMYKAKKPTVAASIAASLLAACGIQAALAQEERDERAYIAPMFSYAVADGDRLSDNGLGGQISLGKPFTRGLNLELTGFYNVYDADDGATAGGEQAEFKGLGLGAMVFVSKTLPNLYVLVSAYYGQTDEAPCLSELAALPASSSGDDCSDYDSSVGDVGLGYLLPLGGMLNHAALRAEARYRMDSHENRLAGRGNGDEYYDGVFNLGLQIPLGRGPEPVEPEPAPVQVVEADSDGDGVLDGTDQCPNTPRGAVVDRVGCETDEDRDGVVDRLDQCPNTPPGTEVDTQGCPVVKCRAPFPGESVGEDGCPSGDVVVLRGVNFEFNEARLTPNARVILDGVADTLLAQGGIEVEIGGHTDALGSDSYNQKLSDQRARAVAQYLASRGVDDARLSAVGYGEAQPIASNETEEGRELNRRVELRILAE